ncbi:MAG: molybdopterin molybdotransferase MoeA [Gammaproteobacteria bacterium]|nr:molybdopterin molybdotransferase MoeA [Gammaproteobacteria bacterium]
MTDKKIKYNPSCMDDYDPSSMDAQIAQQHILHSINSITETEVVPIREALHRVVAENIRSTINVPGHTNSAMDGYAIKSSDIPSEETKQLNLIGTAWAGRPFNGNVNDNECVRIMTGAAMPKNTDTVVMQEHVQINDKIITIDNKQQAQQNVRQAGEDIAENDLVFTPGKFLNPSDIGLIASLGIGEIKVIRKLRAAFFSTGDELVSIGTPLEVGQIYDSNRYTLWSMLTRLGVEINDLGVVRDTPEAVEDAFLKASNNADIVITSGGVSVGDADFVKETLEKLGEVNFWKVAMKPGRPLAFGKIRDAYFFGLPGNPVSVMVTFYIFVQAAIEKMMGCEPKARIEIQAISKSELRKRPGRVEYQRGTYTLNEDGKYIVSKTGAQGSGILRSMSDANCFIFLPMDSNGIKIGDKVEIWPFDSFV